MTRFRSVVQHYLPPPDVPLQWIIGDAIVWWRACVIWRNKVVYCLGPVFVALTLGVFGYLMHVQVRAPGHMHLTPLTLSASLDSATSRASSRRRDLPSWRCTTRSSTPLLFCPLLRTSRRLP